MGSIGTVRGSGISAVRGIRTGCGQGFFTVSLCFSRHVSFPLIARG